MELKIPVSAGELLDKICILTIKLAEIKDEYKLKNIRTEVDHLNIIAHDCGLLNGAWLIKLLTVNRQLWDIENKIRECESKGDFGPEFIHLARAVYLTNDKRYEIKNQINITYQSAIIEEKSYD